MKTLEDQVREHFEQTVRTGQPVSGISIPAATSRGLSLLRRRRARLAGTPALAAIAVLAIALAGLLPGGAAGPPAPASSAAPRAVAPRLFNPLVPYGWFGWLPPGQRIRTGIDDRVSNLLAVDSSQWQLSTWANGQCHRTTQTVPSGPDAHHRAPYLDCGTLGRADIQLGAPGPAVNGHRTFWGRSPDSIPQAPERMLVWEYARGGWATLIAPSSIKDSASTALRVADAVQFGSTSRQLWSSLLSCPTSPLTGRSAPWRSAAAAAAAAPANQITIGSGSAANPGYQQWPWSANLPEVLMGPAGGCYAPDPSVGTSVTRVINGYKVILSNYHAVKGGFSGLPYQELCAGDADGLWVDMTVYGRHPVLTPASVFARMKLLATDPAHWTTIPFG